MKKLRALALSAIVAGTLFSCQKEESTAETDSISEVPTSEFSQEFLDKMESLDFNTEFIEKIEITRLDGSVVPGIQLDSDIRMEMSKFDEMMEHYDQELEEKAAGSKQYVTPSRVSQNRVINILGFTGSGNALSQEARTTLGWAVDNLNAAGTNLTFNLQFGTNFQPFDIVVFFNPRSPGGGTIASAGFPSGGRPNKFVELYPTSRNFTGDGLEAIITHEIGHSLGFRHTDWFSRESCGRISPEPRFNAVYVPGTPQGVDPGSIMLACAQPGSDGEFNRFDILSLRAMYPR